MKIQRHFAIKGTDILYVDKDKPESIPATLRARFKTQICREGDIKSFTEKVRVPVRDNGYFVDDSSNA